MNSPFKSAAEESAFAAKVVHSLAQSAQQLSPEIVEKLRAQREQVMAQYRAPVAATAPLSIAANELALAGSLGGSGNGGWGNSLRQHPLLWALPLVTALAIAVGAYFANLDHDPESEAGELDAVLLGSDLPIDSLLDQNFKSLLISAAE